MSRASDFASMVEKTMSQRPEAFATPGGNILASVTDNGTLRVRETIPVDMLGEFHNWIKETFL